MKSNTLKAWETEASPDVLTEAMRLIRLDAEENPKEFLEGAKVDLGGE
ncbi:MAG: hypothetical protein ACOH5I_09625 [Oligoflexus sp.]